MTDTLIRPTIDPTATVTITRKCSTCTGDGLDREGRMHRSCSRCGRQYGYRENLDTVDAERMPCGCGWSNLRENEVPCGECNSEHDNPRPGTVTEQVTLGELAAMVAELNFARAEGEAGA